jgi:hypothetical protein
MWIVEETWPFRSREGGSLRGAQEKSAVYEVIPKLAEENSNESRD